jgi:hypothetical protein
MPVTISPTPNPNALKFEVGKDVGGPKTFAAGQEVDDELAAALLELPGVVSVFMTADFVTLSKGPEGAWEIVAPEAQRLIGAHFNA